MCEREGELKCQRRVLANYKSRSTKASHIKDLIQFLILQVYISLLIQENFCTNPIKLHGALHFAEREGRYLEPNEQ